MKLIQLNGINISILIYNNNWQWIHTTKDYLIKEINPRKRVKLDPDTRQITCEKKTGYRWRKTLMLKKYVPEIIEMNSKILDSHL